MDKDSETYVYLSIIEMVWEVIYQKLLEVKMILDEEDFRLRFRKILSYLLRILPKFTANK